MMRAIQTLVFLTALLHGRLPAHAQNPQVDPGGQMPSVVPGNGLLSGASLGAAGQGTADPRVSTITTGTSGAARTLAAGYPAAQRASVERVFNGLLQAYSKVETSVGIPAGDAAGAVALFAIATFEAYGDIDVDPKHYQPVIVQLRRVLQANPDFARASAVQKRELYEQMAILGMFVAARRIEVKKTANPTALRGLRGAAGQYISQAFKIDPGRLQIGSSGVVVSGTGAIADRASAPAGPASAPAGAGRFPIDRLAVVLNSWYLTRDMSGQQMVETFYLLFKDGTCTRDLPTSLADFDPAASRAANPEKWGRWRKRGAKYEVALAGQSFTEPSNEMTYEPARRGERLSGKWSSSSGGAVGPDTVYWSNSAVVFTKEGRFETYSSGGSGGSSGDTTSYAVHDDEGSASSVSNENIAGGHARRSGNSKADRSGTYSLDGYALTLRFDSGRVERHLFVARADRGFIYFRGSDMNRDKEYKPAATR
jgi:hypothetical protein